MAIDPVSKGNTFEEYIQEVRDIWAHSKSADLPFRVQHAMEKMLAATHPDDPWMAELIGEGKPSRELYRDPEYGFIQMGHVHPAGHGNAPHDHGPCWVVYGAYKGLTEITVYECSDDGKDPAKAALRATELHQLGPGVVYPYLTGQIHSTHAAQAPGLVFRFLSADLNKISRRRYDLETGAVTLLEPQP